MVTFLVEPTCVQERYQTIHGEHVADFCSKGVPGDTRMTQEVSKLVCFFMMFDSLILGLDLIPNDLPTLGDILVYLSSCIVQKDIAYCH